MTHRSFYQPGGMVFEEVQRRSTPVRQHRSTLIWCFVCKQWIPAYTNAESCPRCGNDEIEHDD